MLYYLGCPHLRFHWASRIVFKSLYLMFSCFRCSTHLCWASGVAFKFLHLMLYCLGCPHPYLRWTFEIALKFLHLMLRYLECPHLHLHFSKKSHLASDSFPASDSVITMVLFHRKAHFWLFKLPSKSFGKVSNLKLSCKETLIVAKYTLHYLQ